jgi:uncharacterized protein YcaQ
MSRGQARNTATASRPTGAEATVSAPRSKVVRAGARGPAAAAPQRAQPEVRLTAGQARRIAINAQQLNRPSAATGAVNRGHLTRLLSSIGLLQIDSVNVLARAHLLPIFSRLGPYPYSLLEGAAWPARNKDRLLYETWAHVASLVPISSEPLLRWRQEEFRTRPWGRVDAVRRDHPGFLDTVLGVIDEQGPSSAGDIEKALAAPGRGISGWWEWSITKTSCEYLFATGTISVAYRRGFERCYDLTERVLPRSVLGVATPSVADAKRSLTALAARSHGIGTVSDLADYYRIAKAETRLALDELVEDGQVIPVQVDGWSELGYLHRDAKTPRTVAGSALLCPFDPLIWERARTQRLFDFHYRIEIYTPAAKRQFGYYVFPLLVGEELVGRFDLKADRLGSRLLVQASWLEVGADPEATAEAAANELRKMANWLDLAEIVVLPRGDFWQELVGQPGMAKGSILEA